jgi:monoamine oxidase
MPPDVLILGAGFAGLSAAIDLARAGLRVEIIEARDRIGGRVFTQFDSSLNHSVELGAEFVHGLAPEIWLPMQEHNLAVSELEGDFWCSTAGKLARCNFFKEVEQILSKMNDKSPDQSFLNFLAKRFGDSGDDESNRHAIGYVSGFNAANPADVSVHWLVHQQKAEEQIQGDRAFHIKGGYQTLLDILSTELATRETPVRLSTKVRQIHWKPRAVEVLAQSARGHETFTTPRALVTLPLGVLQEAALNHDGDLRFEPGLPEEKLAALEKLAMGKVVRVALCFRRRLWESIRVDGQTLARMSFLFSDDETFPTWWTQSPDPVPVITGWAAARYADSLSGMTDGRVVDKAIESLAAVLGQTKASLQSELVAAYFHDWNSDPFSLGAYSYVKVGGEGCQTTLGAPLENTLFFAGEATDISGNNGTVHGAIASGKRAAQEIISAQ